MSPKFASAVDPILKFILSVMDEIESGRSLQPEDVNAQLRGLIDQAENNLGQRSDWELAKYALAAWVDDLLIEAPWEGRTWWEQNRLEWQLFRSADAFTAFYLQAKKATELPVKDALEVFYVCVVLGFRGLYGDREAVAHAAEIGLPKTLEEWARRMSASIQLGQGRPQLLEQGRPGPGAPPLEGKYLLIGSALFFLVLLVVNLIVGYRLFADS